MSTLPDAERPEEERELLVPLGLPPTPTEAMRTEPYRTSAEPVSLDYR
jgi:hypothetical protein